MSDANHAQPSRDPADDGTLMGTVNTILRKFLQGVDDHMPARVVSYDRTANRVQVVPLVKMLTTDGRAVGRAQIASIPVVQLGGGGFVLNFPLKPGDLGWIKANDRDISLVLQSFKDSVPNSMRLHKFDDAVFYPDAMRGWVIAGADADNAVLQSLDGTVKLSIGADRVTVAAGSNTYVCGPSGHVFTGPVIINGVVFDTHRHAPSVIPPSNP